MTHIKIDKSKVKDMDLSELEPLSIVDGPDFSEAGVEAYKFYAYQHSLQQHQNC